MSANAAESLRMSSQVVEIKFHLIVAYLFWRAKQVYNILWYLTRLPYWGSRNTHRKIFLDGWKEKSNYDIQTVIDPQSLHGFTFFYTSRLNNVHLQNLTRLAQVKGRTISLFNV